MRERKRRGFTLLELMVALALIGILAAFAVPSWQQMQRDNRLKGVARNAANALLYARAQAVLSERVHVVYLATGAGTDVCGNPLVDDQGNPVPLLVLDDGPLGDPLQNCCIDAGEAIFTEPAVPGVAWGTSFAGAPVPSDLGLGDFTTGSSFADPFGAQTSWVMFRPDGIPVAFTAACAAGPMGSARGGVYVTNEAPFQNRDYAVVLSPLGTAKVHGFERGNGNWTD